MRTPIGILVAILIIPQASHASMLGFGIAPSARAYEGVIVGGLFSDADATVYVQAASVLQGLYFEGSIRVAHPLGLQTPHIGVPIFRVRHVALSFEGLEAAWGFGGNSLSSFGIFESVSFKEGSLIIDLRMEHSGGHSEKEGKDFHYEKPRLFLSASYTHGSKLHMSTSISPVNRSGVKQKVDVAVQFEVFDGFLLGLACRDVIGEASRQLSLAYCLPLK